MKRIFLVLGLLLAASALSINCQTADKPKLYDPSLDGMKQIKEAIAQAAKSQKHMSLCSMVETGADGVLNSMPSVRQILQFQ
jgi:hypothetical protein